jgi:hypothetical protein
MAKGDLTHDEGNIRIIELVFEMIFIFWMAFVFWCTLRCQRSPRRPRVSPHSRETRLLPLIVNGFTSDLERERKETNLQSDWIRVIMMQRGRDESVRSRERGGRGATCRRALASSVLQNCRNGRLSRILVGGLGLTIISPDPAFRVWTSS